MRTLSLLAGILFLAGVLSAQPLYQSKSFSVFADKVVQGKYEAVATSTDAITSTYSAAASFPVKNKISFKLAINGQDNERGFGKNHTFFINPELSTQSTPVYIFGEAEPEVKSEEVTLTQDVTVTFRVDMRPVLTSIKEKGFYETFNKVKITAEEYKGVFLAGGTLPLSWDFDNLFTRKNAEFKDTDGDGIFELPVLFKKEVFPEGHVQDGSWKLTADLASYPVVNHGQVLLDALYKKTLEELILDIRPDGALMAGKEWPGVWTRDISYSIILSVAAVNPEAAKISLMAKVKNGKIIQDTGTGGSWPCSSDRMVWAMAAWEVYLSTGDQNWLKSSFDIISASAKDDQKVILDQQTGLAFGETSFIDWREQSYPKWMDPKDIYLSAGLGTNVVHYKTYSLLGEMAKELGKKDEFTKVAASIKKAVNKYFWMEDKGYFAMYRYGRLFPSVLPKSEALGEALAVLTGLSDAERSKKIMESVPVYEFGVPTFFPQIPDMNPYHNNSVWPFVQAFFTLAGKQTGNTAVTEHGLAVMTRAAGLFLTNKENMVASTGAYMGTEINSDRQVWSVAGNLAMTYKLLFGLGYTAKGLIIEPTVPEAWASNRTLKGMKYRNTVVNLAVNGFGNGVKSVVINGKPAKSAFIPAGSTGEFNVDVTLNGKWPSGKINLVDHVVQPANPVVKLESGKLIWEPVKGAVSYEVIRNGKKLKSVKETEFTLKPATETEEFQVLAVDAAGVPSMLSEPVLISPEKKKPVIVDVENETTEAEIPGFLGSGYVKLTKSKNLSVSVSVTVPTAGTYWIDFRYSNGSGPINTDNKCAIRSLYLGKSYLGAIVLPQRGDENWKEWGWSGGVFAKLKKGKNSFRIAFDPWNENMNMEVNTALLDQIRLTPVGK